MADFFMFDHPPLLFILIAKVGIGGCPLTRKQRFGAKLKGITQLLVREVATELRIRKQMYAAMHMRHDLILRNSDEVCISIHEDDVVPGPTAGRVLAVECLDNRGEETGPFTGAGSAGQMCGNTACPRRTGGSVCRPSRDVRH